MIETINQLTGLAQASTMYYPPGMAGRLKLAGEVTAKAIPDSIHNTSESVRGKIRNRSIGALSLAIITGAQVYADDNIFYGIFSKVKEMAGNSVGVAWGVTSVVAAAGQTFFARKNQKHIATELAAQAYERKPEVAPAETFTDRFSERFDAVKEHTRKASVTLLALGVPGHVMVEPMTKKEVWAHGIFWGATAPAFYTVANISFGALDNPVAPFGVAALLSATRYINNSWERAGEVANLNVMDAASREAISLPVGTPNVA
ncbi:MAG: hypothetical protein JWO47_187 [Candidatus Saccharibacteria bacterium]|nr:hypothetical protein [Candidatus Saccharibacteria bacterium]